MIAIRKRPGERAEIVEIENELSALQKEVGGYLESVTFAEDAAILCDEEGRLKGYAYNCNICGVDFVGPILVVGVDGEEFCDLADAEEVRKLLFPTRMTKRMDNGILLRLAFDIRIDPDDYDRAQAILETVVQSNFMRSYRARAAHEREQMALPADIRQTMQQLAADTRMRLEGE